MSDSESYSSDSSEEGGRYRRKKPLKKTSDKIEKDRAWRHFKKILMKRGWSEAEVKKIWFAEEVIKRKKHTLTSKKFAKSDSKKKPLNSWMQFLKEFRKKYNSEHESKFNLRKQADIAKVEYKDAKKKGKTGELAMFTEVVKKDKKMTRKRRAELEKTDEKISKLRKAEAEAKAKKAKEETRKAQNTQISKKIEEIIAKAKEKAKKGGVYIKPEPIYYRCSV